MLTLIRRFQKGTLIIVTAFIVVAFAFLYSDFDFVTGTVGRQNCAVKVYDRCYRLKEARKFASHYDVAIQLGMFDFATVLFGEDRRDQREQHDRTGFIVGLIILRAEAERLGIEPSPQEIREAIPDLPVFQQPWMTTEIVRNNILGPNGFSEGDFARLVKDYLAFQKLRDLLGTGIRPVPSETERRYLRENQRYNASLIRFDHGKFAEGVEVSEEEIAEYYEANTEDLLSEPKRAFDFVKFTPAPLPEDATNEQRSRAQLDFANAVNRVYSRFAEEDADFNEVAASHEGEHERYTLERGSFPLFPRSAPPEELEADHALLEGLFSEVLQAGGVTVPYQTEEGGYFVFYFSEQQDPQPLTLEEARESIVETLVARKSSSAAHDAAGEALDAINATLEQGGTFAEAAAAAGHEAEALPSFSEAEPPPGIPEAGVILRAVAGLGDNETSPVVELPGEAGFLIVHVESIELYEDEAAETRKGMLAASTRNRLERAMFSAWFNDRRAEFGPDHYQPAVARIP